MHPTSFPTLPRTSPHSLAWRVGLVLAAALGLAGAASAQSAPAEPAATSPADGFARSARAPADVPQAQVIVPQVERRELKVPHLPSSNDFELGLFGGSYATQTFGTSAQHGARLGYHLNEDFFVEAAYGASRVNDAVFRQILPGGVLPQSSEKLSYQTIALGFHVLPGEVFVGRDRAWPSALYVLAGVGTTRFDQQRLQTAVLGLGMRVQLRDWAALRVDVQDHYYGVDLLGRRQATQNLGLNLGLSWLF